MNKEVIRAINDSPVKAFITTAGAGQSFLPQFMEFSGASRTVLGGYIPYKQELFDAFIGEKPDRYAGSEAARKLAVASFLKGVKCNDTKHTVGIGCASSIATENERVGRKHKISVALHSREITAGFDLVINQGRSRAEEEKIASDFILTLLANSCGVDSGVDLSKIDSYEIFDQYLTKARPELVELYFGKRTYLSNFEIEKKDKVVIYPGSFNPVTPAHREIFEISKKITGETPVLELSLDNYSKPPLDYFEIEKRRAGLSGFQFLMTNAPMFVDKVSIINQLYFPKEMIFVVGLDVLERIRNWISECSANLSYLSDWEVMGVKFLVFGRNGKLFNKKDSPMLGSVILNTPETWAYNNPVSSTEIRTQNQLN